MKARWNWKPVMSVKRFWMSCSHEMQGFSCQSCVEKNWHEKVVLSCKQKSNTAKKTNSMNKKDGVLRSLRGWHRVPSPFFSYLSLPSLNPRQETTKNKSKKQMGWSLALEPWTPSMLLQQIISVSFPSFAIMNHDTCWCRKNDIDNEKINRQQWTIILHICVGPLYNAYFRKQCNPIIMSQQPWCFGVLESISQALSFVFHRTCPSNARCSNWYLR